MNVTAETNIAGTRNELKTQNQTKTINVSKNKFHPIFGNELGVAIETTFSPTEKLIFVSELYSKDLVFRNNFLQRIYCPAVAKGNLWSDQEANINFLSILDKTEIVHEHLSDGTPVPYCRLCLRLRPMVGNFFRWVRFGRFQSEDAPEEKTFGFDPVKPPFINLDFFSKRNEKFLPLFVKVKADSGELIYFVIEGQWSEETVTLKIRKVTESEAPPHLVAAKP